MDMPEDHIPTDAPKVFLSYSRRDREQAQRIADVLRNREFGVFRDTDDILPTEEWRGRLQQLIEEADTIVFLLSPHSARSEVCAWEVEFAASLNKRIAPIVIEDVDAAEIPEALAKLNYVFCTERDRFEDAVDTLVSALNQNIGWIREHTRLNGLAARWQKAGRPARLLLRGQDIRDAEVWRDERPAKAPIITTLQAAFVAASRLAAGRRQKLFAGASLAGLLIAVGLAGMAYFQRTVAVENEKRAITNEQLANDTRDGAWRTQSDILTSWAREATDKGDRTTAALLLLAALPDEDAAQSRVDHARPLLENAEKALFHNHFYGQEVAVLDPVRDAEGKPAWIREVVFSPDGDRLLTLRSTSGTAATLRIWDTQTAELMHQKTIEGDRVLTMAFAPDGKTLAVLFENQRGVILDPETGDTITPFAGCLDAGETDWNTGEVIFSKDGTRFVTIGHNICIWNADDGALDQRVTHHSGSQPYGHAAFSHDERYLFYTANRDVLVSDLQSGQQLMLYPGAGRVEIQFDAGRTRAIISDFGSPVLAPRAPVPEGYQWPSTKLWDLLNPGPIAVLSEADALTTASFSPDGKTVVANQGNRVKLWDAQTGELLPAPGQSPQDEDYFVQNDVFLISAGYTPDGSHVYTLDYEGALKFWNRKGRLINQVFKPRTSDGFYSGFTFDPTFTHMVSYTQNGAFTLWRANTPRNLKSLDVHLNESGAGDIDTQTRAKIADHFRQRSEAKFQGADWPSRDKVEAATAQQPDGSLQARWMRHQDDAIAVTSTANGAQTRIGTDGFTVQSVAFRGGTTELAIAGRGGIIIADAQSGEQRATIGADDLSGLPYRARTVLYSADGAYLIVISEDYVDLFDAATATKVASFMSEDTIVNATTPADYFDMVENRFVAFMQSDLQPLRWKQGKDDLRPRFWRVINGLQDLIAHEKASAPRCLSRDQLQRYFLGEVPPRWCITGTTDAAEGPPESWQPRFPYRGPHWRDWLSANDPATPPPLQ